jgi:two-component system chemotaxis sensor kinase CheA
MTRAGAGHARRAILPLPAARRAGGGKLRILAERRRGGIAYGFADVIDIVPLVGDIRPAARPARLAAWCSPAVSRSNCSTLIGCSARRALTAVAPSSGAGRLVCAIPPGDPWLENMLRPMVESLGYTRGPRGEGVAADLVIASAESPAPPACAGAQLLRLRATPDAAGQGADTIYRYDRAALLAALGGASEARRHG